MANAETQFERYRKGGHDQSQQAPLHPLSENVDGGIGGIDLELRLSHAGASIPSNQATLPRPSNTLSFSMSSSSSFHFGSSKSHFETSLGFQFQSLPSSSSTPSLSFSETSNTSHDNAGTVVVQNENPRQRQRQRQQQRQPRTRRNSRNPLESSELPRQPYVPQFPWATEHHAIVHTLDHLIDSGITSIKGDVYCKQCQAQYQIEYDLESKFHEIKTYIIAKMGTMHDRAPKEWMNPDFPDCKQCRKAKSLRPLPAERSPSINWLFLFLGKMLGILSLEDLKQFCKNTNIHRTGAKDRVLYSTYLEICRQLDPSFRK